MNPQVLVVGAGPVGLTMAAELARYGVSVRIVDKAAARTDKSKALVLWSRTLELLDCAACAQSFVDAGHKVEAANIVAGNRVIAHVTLDGVDSAYAYALMLPQSETERLLEAHLNSLGVTIERQVEALSFADRDAGVATLLRHADGREETVQSDWLIGCDGAHSMVRHALNLPFSGDTLKSDWLLADLHLKQTQFPESQMATYMHADGVLVFFPMGRGRYRIIADIGVSQGPHPVDPSLDEVQALIDRRGPGGIVASDPVWLSAFRINERKVENYRVGRVLLAGDAAHVHSPAGGQGMNTGMQDAINLAWKLALVCKGSCAQALLDSYSVERSAIGEQVLANAGRLTAVGVLKNHTAQAIRNIVGGLLFGLAPVRRAMAETLTELSVGYAHSPLNGAHVFGAEGPRPGERVRPVAGQTPVGAGHTPKFALFAASAPPSLLSDPLLEEAARLPLAAGVMHLARPDGYVALVAKEGNFAEVADYLGALRAGGN